MNWHSFEQSAWELAAIGRKRIEEPRLVLVGTVKRDGSPRISPVEAFFVSGELMLGMMWRSKKALEPHRHQPRNSALGGRHGHLQIGERSGVGQPLLLFGGDKEHQRGRSGQAAGRRV